MSEQKAKIRVGLIAFGMVGQVFHGPLISSHPQFELTHVFERRSSKSKELYPNVVVVRSLEELLSTDVDVVVVGTPSGDHYEHAKAAIEAGKHVVVEKPFTVTAKEADELIALASAKKVILTVFHNRRFDSDFLTVKKIVDSNVLGTLTELEIHYDRCRTAIKDNWREKEVPGSGILYDLGSHLIDQAILLVGSAPDSVFGDIRHMRTGALAPDFFSLDLRFASHPNLRVTLHSSMLVRSSLPRYTLHGTAGTFVKAGMDVQEDLLRAGQLPIPPSSSFAQDTWGLEPSTSYGELYTEIGSLSTKATVVSERGNYLRFYTQLAEAIHSQGLCSPPVLPTQARDVIRVIEMATESSKKGCLVHAKDMWP
eukprot:c8726_g1_i1.p1 GENE.c8726_g1_i1~~c8726_g1_i1.p1  ORF type:complete len:387 (-),score=84.91 c8726_g1_i1:72-1175(-)